MERLAQRPGGEQEPEGEVGTPPDLLAVANEGGLESWDERVIREGIDAAVTEGRPIDDRTARYIAGQLHGGQGSALYALASSGAIDERVFNELDQDRTERPAVIRSWLSCLTIYCASRSERGPVDGWVEQAEAQDRTDLMRRISAADVSTLGNVAIVETSGEPEEDDNDEADTYSWADAATWTAALDAEDIRTTIDRAGLAEEEFDALFAGDADEEVSDVDELGWYGILRWKDRPGGLLLKLDSDGRRQTWVVDSNETLEARWTTLTSEYEHYHEEREAYDLAVDQRSDTPSGLSPRIWVASLADYTNGELHGQWFDATREASELELATKFMLRSSRTPHAEEWGIFDYNEFYGADLSEYESFETISRIAQGIAEHGEAFGHWAAYVGTESTEQIERFEDHYRGEWDSFEAYVRDYLEETGFYQFLEGVAEDMRGYVEVDVEQIARDWTSDYHTVTLQNGRTCVFDTHT